MSEATSAREAILNRIRTANANTSPSAYEDIERKYQQSAGVDRETIWKTFVNRLHEYDARVFEVTPETIALTIAEALTSCHQKSAVVANEFPQQYLPAGFAWRRDSETTTDQLNTAEGAISGCEVAIAHTGTIILKGARKLTLLPDRFLCVVHENQIVETVPEAIVGLEHYKTETLTFVSGPSATADIEMTRIRGVHGPRFLDVVLVRG